MAARLTVVRIVSQIKAELDRVLENATNLTGSLQEPSGILPRVDVAQSDSKLRLFFEVPGTLPEDLEIEITNNVLKVSGVKKPTGGPAAGARYLRVERQCGHFERSVELPAAVNPGTGRAIVELGVLSIEFPLVSDQRNRTYRLEIEAGEVVE